MTTYRIKESKLPFADDNTHTVYETTCLNRAEAVLIWYRNEHPNRAYWIEE